MRVATAIPGIRAEKARGAGGSLQVTAAGKPSIALKRSARTRQTTAFLTFGKIFQKIR
jgi:hypothetical protein